MNIRISNIQALKFTLFLPFSSNILNLLCVNSVKCIQAQKAGSYICNIILVLSEISQKA